MINEQSVPKFDRRLERALARYEEIGTLLIGEASSNDGAAFSRLSKEYADLGEVAARISDLKRLRQEWIDLEALSQETQGEADMQTLTAEELEHVAARWSILLREIQLLLLPKDEADARNAILEIRAGTGGQEAALFAADLFRMYQRYADLHGWRLNLMSIHETGIGGFKEISAEISGRNVFSRLKFESGVHRVQRVPETESGGRIHTSAATVAVLPEAEEVDLCIQDSDLRIDVFRASGPGGQSVNTTDSAVRITHLPTGIMVSQQDEKSQHKNKAKAMKILRARLYDAERKALDAERAADRKAQIGSGDRSERIRTYNFPQARVTDHRINMTLYKLEKILNGEALDELVDALLAEDEAERLAAME